MIYGITGGIASGKSTILKELKKLNYNILNLDDISHDILLEKDIKNRILNEIDNDILNENLDIDRSKLSKIVFNDNDKLKKLNEIMHKPIIEKMKQYINEFRFKNENLVIEVPLLFELNLEYLFDKIILAYVKPEIQVTRIIKRDKKTSSEALKIMNSQLDIEKKISKSDIVIDTNIDIEKLKNKIKKEF